ncbi:ADP-ribosylation factor-related [Dictyostelium discoideum AX4]|uniref:ADP-ribosylation factor F n=1 Tax=Dictyostelium discoideum TaxID=44689 RepID=ARFF_DICDI|nr:ADP-ribosylation factor-related [Dictyostelium discoideum AX4]Q54HK2.1 RecName: Full=ADP-ribosylation factor F [Dictyostelium discoideum]EAL62745.1 ADP-ribosylation factor-related [Dictyostelium discoideum AX4]|eukprot:XP_636231.1 ADP-ribosylation factor-related [Dictyostelium discoideum AX4]
MLSEFFNNITSFFVNIFSLFEGKRNIRILMIGLDGAGKSTLLYKLKFGDVIRTIPTIGFNVEIIEYKNLSMNVWDIGGQNNIRALWRQYDQRTDVFIFVVDSTDRERFDEVKQEIKNIIEQNKNESSNASLLIFANKQDMLNPITPAELVNSLDLNSLTNKKWHVQPCSAVRGDGIYEGFDWIVSNSSGK